MMDFFYETLFPRVTIDKNLGRPGSRLACSVRLPQNSSYVRESCNSHGIQDE